MADGDWTPDMARDRNVEAIAGAVTAWDRALVLLRDSANSDPGSDSTRRLNSAVASTWEGLEDLCEALVPTCPGLAQRLRFCDSPPDLARVREVVLRAMDGNDPPP